MQLDGTYSGRPSADNEYNYGMNFKCKLNSEYFRIYRTVWLPNVTVSCVK